MECKKCQSKDVYAIGLCRNCYNKYYYNARNYGQNLKDFITTEKKTHYKTEQKNYSQFVELYGKEKISKTKLAKDLGISRETLYKYIKKYKGE